MEGMCRTLIVGVLGMFVVLQSSHGQETNIALNKTATQLQTFDETASGGFAWSANKSVDGRFNETQYCSASLASAGDNFWEVDLGAEFIIGRIVVYSRPDANAESQLRGFELYVVMGNTTRQLVYTNDVNTSFPGDGRVEVTVDPAVMGQHVRVERSVDPSVIAMCEVEVYEAEDTNNGTTTTVNPTMSSGNESTTMVPGSTTMASGSTTMAASNTTMGPGSTTMASGSTTMAAGTTTMGPATTTMAVGMTTTETTNGAFVKMTSLPALLMSLLLVFLWN